MPGIVGLVSRISQHVCTRLAEAGLAIATLLIVSASNASPIVVGTDAPHDVPQSGAHVLVAGVGGNAAANGAMLALPISETTLALYTLDAYGNRVPAVGSGAYTSGGTLKISLRDGRILLGRQHVRERSSAPRIIFFPRASKFGPKDVAHPSNRVGFPAADLKLEWSSKAIASDLLSFEVRAWGVGSDPNDDDGSYDATQTLYQQVISSVHELCPGLYAISDGAWTDADPKATQDVRAGREFRFGLTLATPVLRVPLVFAPHDVHAATKSNMVVNGGIPETGCDSQ